MGNPFIYAELCTANLAQAKEFYTKVFDWQVTPYPEAAHPYEMVSTGHEPEGGMMEIADPQAPKGWYVYIQVENLEAACAKIQTEGGQIHMGRTLVDGFGHFAVAADPQGVIFGIWENLAK